MGYSLFIKNKEEYVQTFMYALNQLYFFISSGVLFDYGNITLVNHGFRTLSAPNHKTKQNQVALLGVEIIILISQLVQAG